MNAVEREREIERLTRLLAIRNLTVAEYGARIEDLAQAARVAVKAARAGRQLEMINALHALGEELDKVDAAVAALK